MLCDFVTFVQNLNFVMQEVFFQEFTMHKWFERIKHLQPTKNLQIYRFKFSQIFKAPFKFSQNNEYKGRLQ